MTLLAVTAFFWFLSLSLFNPKYFVIAENHLWLLDEEVDILPRLLLPLAGPEEFPEDEMEKLPLDLQYLSPDKTREPDPDIRRMLLEAITQVIFTFFNTRIIKYVA